MKTRILTFTDLSGQEYTTQREDWLLSEAVAGAMESYPESMGAVINIKVEVID